MLALIIYKTQAIGSSRNQGEENLLSGSITERKKCVKYLGIFFNELSNFSFQIAEVVEELSKHYSAK